MTNSIVMSKLDHFGFHNYAGSTGGADARIKRSAYPSKELLDDESSRSPTVSSLQSVREQQACRSGTPTTASTITRFWRALLPRRPRHDAAERRLATLAGVDCVQRSSGVYTPRPQFYQTPDLQVRSGGSVRIAATESNSSLTIYAFRASDHRSCDDRRAQHRLVVDHRQRLAERRADRERVSSSIRAASATTTAAFTRGADVVVTNGSFTFTAPVNSYFTLTTVQ